MAKIYNPYEVIPPEIPPQEPIDSTVRTLMAHRALCFIWALSSFISLFVFDSSVCCRVFAAIAIITALSDSACIGYCDYVNDHYRDSP